MYLYCCGNCVHAFTIFFRFFVTVNWLMIGVTASSHNIMMLGLSGRRSRYLTTFENKSDDHTEDAATRVLFSGQKQIGFEYYISINSFWIRANKLR